MQFIYAIIALAFVISCCYLGLQTIGVPVVFIVGGSGLIAWFAWIKFNLKHPANASVILVPFLLTCGCLMAHINEEYYFQFPEAMSQLFNINFTMEIFISVFMLAGPTLYFFTAVGLYYRNALANYLAWFILIGPGVAEFTHLIFPLIAMKQGLTESYSYFPGMYTFWMPMIPGIYGIYAMIKYRHKA